MKNTLSLNIAKRATLALTLGLLFSWSSFTWAQNYPSKPVKIVIPFAAGGPADVMVRAIAQKLGDTLGQAVVVDNKPGANEIIGADFVAKSAPDGYTLLVASDGAFSLNQSLYPKIPYDPAKDFAPIGKLATGQLMLVTRADFPANSVGEFIDYVKAHPGKLNYASIGAGGVNHLASAWFNNIHGLQMEHIAFKGLPAAVQELMAGRIDAMFSVTGGVASYLDSGKVKPLAISGKTRQPAAPKVPTFGEVGYPNFDASYYFGVVAPRGTPSEITQRLSKEINLIVNTNDFKAKYLQPLGFEAVGDTPEQFAAFMKIDRELGAQKVKISGAKLD
jgi:tripartite-type tricarboxylate transporter receptor subunit TctC